MLQTKKEDPKCFHPTSDNATINQNIPILISLALHAFVAQTITAHHNKQTLYTIAKQFYTKFFQIFKFHKTPTISFFFLGGASSCSSWPPGADLPSQFKSTVIFEAPNRSTPEIYNNNKKKRNVRCSGVPNYQPTQCTRSRLLYPRSRCRRDNYPHRTARAASEG